MFIFNLKINIGRMNIKIQFLYVQSNIHCRHYWIAKTISLSDDLCLTTPSRNTRLLLEQKAYVLALGLRRVMLIHKIGFCVIHCFLNPIVIYSTIKALKVIAVCQPSYSRDSSWEILKLAFDQW